MKIEGNIREVRNSIKKWKENNLSIGFVPTMGALHDGHIELVKKAREENDIVVVSIFVNPTQFNDKKDLERYPRDLQKDCLMLEGLCDMVFAPEVKDIYPDDFHYDPLDLNGLDTCMEGAFRPGHFQGVVMVVERLFNIIPADKAYFGEKDYQQLTIIRYMVKKKNIPVKIIPCPIIREQDGLAMSSRNMLLSAQHREIAPLIFKTLKESKEMAKKYTVKEIKSFVSDQINRNPLLECEYFEIADLETLMPIADDQMITPSIGCIAVFAGNIRLIDNIKYNL